MKSLQKVVLMLMLLICVHPSFGRTKTYKEGEILVKLKPNVDAVQLIQRRQSVRRQSTNLRCKQMLSEPMNIYNLTFDSETVDEEDLLQSLRSDPTVEIAQFNHKLTLRSKHPNDPRYYKQWQYVNDGSGDGVEGADIDADLAWEVTTGGLSYYGDTIVVCIIDGGFDTNHEDLAANVWVNKAEIPDNDIDDDGNGYVDDYYGWCTADENDDIGNNGSDHGTAVAGIVGAVGNNGIGVAGVNWDIKMMMVSGGSGYEDDAIAAYSYALQARKRYNETNGQEGAFVVATNSSWGVNEEFAEDAPLWCEMYNSLGEVGILSAGATANEDLDVEVSGDLPTTCTSDYLITVTNVASDNVKIEWAGYGKTSIDMGAYGEETYSILPSNLYDSFGGTSAATPHVAGAIALLYSAPCPGFMDLVKTDPAGAALKMKSYILEGGTDNASLKDITVTGKCLNLNGSINLMLSDCDGCVAPVRIIADSVTDVRAVITWDIVNSDALSDTLRWRVLGDNMWTSIAEPEMPFEFTGLTSCTDYEIQMNCACSSDTSDYSASYIFRTDGCYENPNALRLTERSDSTLSFTWESVLVADSYALRLREIGSLDWTSVNVEATTHTFTSLIACGKYEAQIKTVSADTLLEFSESLEVKTAGCGPCTDLDYCSPMLLDPEEEWLANVSINTLDNSTSKSEEGYEDFTEMETTILKTYQSYELSVTPGYIDPEEPWDDYIYAWIDFNGDGEFDNDTERVLNSEPVITTTTASVVVPADAYQGAVRMRVILCSDYPDNACDAPDIFGETEDYCITIEQGEAAGLKQTINENDYVDISPNPFTDKLVVTCKSSDLKNNVSIQLIDCTGKLIHSRSNIQLIENKTIELDVNDCPSGVYIILLKSNEGIIHQQVLIKE